MQKKKKLNLKAYCVGMCQQGAWNSTYHMLDLFKNFQKAFERLEKDYPHFWFYFKGEEDKGRKLLGLPNDINWDHARVFFFFFKF